MALCISKKKKDRPTQKKVGSSEEEYFSYDYEENFFNDAFFLFYTSPFDAIWR